MISSSSCPPGLSIAEYAELSAETDKFDPQSLTAVLLGIFGEVGSLMTISKKFYREGWSYPAHRNAVIEEFGDILWYLAALCRRMDYSLEDFFRDVSNGEDVSTVLVTGMTPEAPVASVRSFTQKIEFTDLLLRLGRGTAALMDSSTDRTPSRSDLIRFLKLYLQAVQACGISLEHIARVNLKKTRGRFLSSSFDQLPNFDADFRLEERIPEEFRIEVTERSSGKSYLRWKGVFIGEPLTDNIQDRDGYRFHDVFHFAHAAVLHWSPTFRALIRHKRKSNVGCDEDEDGGRAIVIEEGLSAYVFSCAKELDFFEGQTSVSFDLLKTVKNFVRGYEVDRCPLWLWERAILQGYSAFRLLLANNGGAIVGDRTERILSYETIE